jgi:hypothetical protein
MPKLYTPNTWEDEVLTEDARYDILEDNGDPYKADMRIDLVTPVATAGTSVNATRMNNIENGIDDLDDALVAGNATNEHALTTKSTPANSDEIKIFDSAASYVAKIVTLTNLWTNYLKAKADALYQALDSDLTAIAALSPTNNDFMQRKSGAWTNRTPAQAAVDILPYVYPVGSIYIAVVSTNPATLLGFGTWTAFATGQTLVGIDTGQTEFDTVEETGGSKTHTLTESELPAHTHPRGSRHWGGAANGASGRISANGVSGAGVANDSDSGVTGSTGSGSAHNNLQPYIVVYMWKRTA